MKINLHNGSAIDCISSQNSVRGSQSKMLMTKVKHKCRHGHEFYSWMELDSKSKLVYASWNNNLCTVDYCDSVGWIDE